MFIGEITLMDHKKVIRDNKKCFIQPNIGFAKYV